MFLLTFPLLTLLLPTYNKSTWLSRCTFQTLKWVISRSSSSLPPPKPWYEDPQHAGNLETTWSRHLPTANFNLMSLSSSTWPPRGIQAGQTWFQSPCPDEAKAVWWLKLEYYEMHIFCLFSCPGQLNEWQVMTSWQSSSIPTYGTDWVSNSPLCIQRDRRGNTHLVR